MVWNIHFQVCGLIVVLLVGILYYRKRTTWLYTDKVFGYMIVNNTLCLIFDIASIFTINFRDDIPNWINETVCKLYLIFLVGVAFLNLVYLVSDVYQDKEDFLKTIRVMSLVMLPVLLMYIILPIDYYVNTDTGSIYTQGMVVNYTYGVCVVLLLLSAIHLIYSYKKVSDLRKNPVLIIIVAFLVAAVIQFMYNQLLIVGFAVSIAVLLIYMFMENPTDKIDIETGLYNLNMMKTYIDQNYSRNKEFFVIAVNIQNYNSLVDTFGILNTSGLLENFARYINSFSGIQAFRIGEQRFAVIGPMENDIYQKAIWNINNTSEVEFTISQTQIMLLTNICIFNESSLLNNSDDVIFYINSLLLDRKSTERIRVVNAAEIERIKRERTIERTIKWALKNDKFQVYYQPIYSIKRDYFISAEALVRLWDEDGKFVSPDNFIPVAEHNGMITELGLVIMEKVCRFISEYRPQKYGMEFIDVNLSVVQCMQNSLADNLLNILSDYGIPLEFIHFEITETAMSNSKRTLVQNMEDLICKGCAFYLDDYGSGYANLNYLVELPFRATKLDKELVWSYFKNSKGKIATKFAVDMLKSLGMEIVAEGVETSEQLEEMKRLEIDYIQGFYFSKALCDADMIEFLVKNQKIEGV